MDRTNESLKAMLTNLRKPLSQASTVWRLLHEEYGRESPYEQNETGSFAEFSQVNFELENKIRYRLESNVPIILNSFDFAWCPTNEGLENGFNEIHNVWLQPHPAGSPSLNVTTERGLSLLINPDEVKKLLSKDGGSILGQVYNITTKGAGVLAVGSNTKLPSTSDIVSRSSIDIEVPVYVFSANGHVLVKRRKGDEKSIFTPLCVSLPWFHVSNIGEGDYLLDEKVLDKVRIRDEADTYPYYFGVSVNPNSMKSSLSRKPESTKDWEDVELVMKLITNGIKEMHPPE